MFKLTLLVSALQLVNSATGPGSTMSEGIYYSADTTDEVKLLWHDPDLTKWEHHISYRFLIEWRPTIGIIRCSDRVVVTQGQS